MPRRIGPSEYDQLRNRYKVGTSNFDQYFIRSGGDILVKDQYDPNAGMSSPTSTSVPPVSETGSPTDFNFNLGTDTQSQSSLLGKAVTELLKSYQGIEKYPFAEKELAASDLQAKRLSFTDPNMIGASPGQQAAVRGASAAAVQPTISGAQQAGQTFASRLATFGDVLGQVQNIQQQQMVEEQNRKAEAQNIITMALNANPTIFDNVDEKQISQLEKAAGYGSGFISQLANAMKLSQQQQLAQQAPQTMETAEGIFQWNPTTGQWEASGLKGEAATSIIESGGRQLLINTATGETIRDLGAVKGQSYAPQAKQAITDASGNVVGYFNPSTGQTEYYEGMGPQQPMSLQEFARQLGEQRQQSIDPNSVQGEYQDYLNGLQQTSQPIGEEEISTTTNLRKEYISNSGEFIKQRDAYNRIVTSGNQPSAAGDLALIFNYMKLLDPGSTVREGEFANAQNSGGVPDRILAQYNKVISGERLSESQRSDFLSRSQMLYNSAYQQQQQLTSSYKGLAEQYGINPDNVIIDLSSISSEQLSGQTSSGMSYQIIQ